MRTSHLAFSLALFIATITGCGPGPATVSQLYVRLDGRGPVLLGDGNDNLPADALLKEQRASSPTLSDFVASHGEPAALSVERRLYRPTQLALYYPNENRRFVFTRWSADWELAGPEKIQSEDRESLAAQLAQAGGELGAAPKAVSEAVPVRRAELANEPMSTQASLARAPLGEQELRGRLKPPQEAQEARLVRLPNGDYRHRVTFEGETLRLLADWYTEDAKNAGALASASRRAPTTPLRIGDEVTIPKRLMRNVQALPEAAVN